MPRFGCSGPSFCGVAISVKKNFEKVNPRHLRGKAWRHERLEETEWEINRDPRAAALQFSQSPTHLTWTIAICKLDVSFDISHVEELTNQSGMAFHFLITLSVFKTPAMTKWLAVDWAVWLLQHYVKGSRIFLQNYHNAIKWILS